jgi:hypothetical protein
MKNANFNKKYDMQEQSINDPNWEKRGDYFYDYLGKFCNGSANQLMFQINNSDEQHIKNINNQIEEEEEKEGNVSCSSVGEEGSCRSMKIPQENDDDGVEPNNLDDVGDDNIMDEGVMLMKHKSAVKVPYSSAQKIGVKDIKSMAPFNRERLTTLSPNRSTYQTTIPPYKNLQHTEYKVKQTR